MICIPCPAQKKPWKEVQSQGLGLHFVDFLRFASDFGFYPTLLTNDMIAIGSGGSFAQAAARALMDNTDLSARDIVEKGLAIAADICIYTNEQRTIEQLDF